MPEPPDLETIGEQHRLIGRALTRKSASSRRQVDGTSRAPRVSRRASGSSRFWHRPIISGRLRQQPINRSDAGRNVTRSGRRHRPIGPGDPVFGSTGEWHSRHLHPNGRVALPGGNRRPTASGRTSEARVILAPQGGATRPPTQTAPTAWMAVGAASRLRGGAVPATTSGRPCRCPQRRCHTRGPSPAPTVGGCRTCARGGAVRGQTPPARGPPGQQGAAGLYRADQRPGARTVFARAEAESGPTRPAPLAVRSARPAPTVARSTRRSARSLAVRSAHPGNWSPGSSRRCRCQIRCRCLGW